MERAELNWRGRLDETPWKVPGGSFAGSLVLRDAGLRESESWPEASELSAQIEWRGAHFQAAIDHGFFIIFDLAMGGNYPDPLCNCTAPTSATTSGGSMSVQYVAVYEEGGNSTPTGTASATGQVTGSGLCLANKGALDTEGNPIIADSCDGDAGQQWSPYTDGTLRTQGGCLDVVSAGTTSGTHIDWYACTGTNAQDSLR